MRFSVRKYFEKKNVSLSLIILLIQWNTSCWFLVPDLFSLTEVILICFSFEVKVAALNILKGESQPVDYIECETREARYA